MDTRRSELGTESIASYVIATTYLRSEASWGKSNAWQAHARTSAYWGMVSTLPASAICLLIAGAIGRRMSTFELCVLVIPIGLATSAYAEKVRKTACRSVAAARSRLDKARRRRLDRIQLFAELLYLALCILAMVGARGFYFRATGLWPAS